MKLNELPLEDLARGVFPDGARVLTSVEVRHELRAGYARPHGREFIVHTEEDVVSTIKSLRRGSPIGSAWLKIDQAQVMGSLPESRIWLRFFVGNDLTHRFGDNTEFSVVRAYKPFKLDLPKWIALRTLYDVVDMEHSLLTEVGVEIVHDDDPMDLQIRVRRESNPFKTELLSARVHLP